MKSFEKIYGRYSCGRHGTWKSNRSAGTGVCDRGRGCTGSNGDDVEITLDDKPYLALRSGSDCRPARHCVLSYMGIEAADFDRI